MVVQELQTVGTIVDHCYDADGLRSAKELKSNMQTAVELPKARDEDVCKCTKGQDCTDTVALACMIVTLIGSR